MGIKSGFDSQIDYFVINTQARLLAVTRTAISGVIDDAQQTVYKGGKMRVDTGFLRASGIAALNSIPAGESVGRKRQPGETEKPLSDYPTVDDYTKSVTLNRALAEMEVGDVFYFGWTARYAKYREAYDGFLESALQNWQSHVDKAVAYFRNKDATR